MSADLFKINSIKTTSYNFVDRPFSKTGEEIIMYKTFLEIFMWAQNNKQIKKVN